MNNAVKSDIGNGHLYQSLMFYARNFVIIQECKACFGNAEKPRQGGETLRERRIALKLSLLLLMT